LRLNEEISGWQRWLTRIVEKSFLSSLDGLICNSQTTLHSVRALLGSNASDPLCAVVAYPGKDHLRGGLTEREIDRRARDGKELRVLFLGNLIPRKGVHWLLAALDASRDFPFHLDLVGDEGRDPTYARHLRQRVEQAGLSDRVRFWGLVAEDTLQRILQENQVLVVPSAYEGFGIAYLDGMRYGLAIVASASGGAGELITEGREGYLIAPGDVFALAKRLRHLHNDRGHLAEMGIAARKRFAEHPTWAESAAKIRQFLLHFLE
jgi:glycosyltransferase involved in cell wall biosynthesis